MGCAKAVVAVSMAPKVRPIAKILFIGFSTIGVQPTRAGVLRLNRRSTSQTVQCQHWFHGAAKLDFDRCLATGDVPEISLQPVKFKQLELEWRLLGDHDVFGNLGVELALKRSCDPRVVWAAHARIFESAIGR